MLSDFLTGHEDMSIHVESYASGALLFEKLHQPWTMFTAHGSFSVACCRSPCMDQQEQQLVQVLLMLTAAPDVPCASWPGFWPGRRQRCAAGVAIQRLAGAPRAGASAFAGWSRPGNWALGSHNDWQTRLDDSNQPQGAASADCTVPTRCWSGWPWAFTGRWRPSMPMWPMSSAPL